MRDSSVWQRFIGQPAALIGALFLLLLGLLAVAAPWLCQGSPWEMNTTPMLEWLLPVAATVAGMFSVAYSLRFTVDVFWGPPADDLPRTPHEPPHWMRVPVELLVLACLTSWADPHPTRPARSMNCCAAAAVSNVSTVGVFRPGRRNWTR